MFGSTSENVSSFAHRNPFYTGVSFFGADLEGRGTALFGDTASSEFSEEGSPLVDSTGSSALPESSSSEEDHQGDEIEEVMDYRTYCWAIA